MRSNVKSQLMEAFSRLAHFSLSQFQGYKKRKPKSKFPGQLTVFPLKPSLNQHINLDYPTTIAFNIAILPCTGQK